MSQESQGKFTYGWAIESGEAGADWAQGRFWYPYGGPLRSQGALSMAGSESGPKEWVTGSPRPAHLQALPRSRGQAYPGPDGCPGHELEGPPWTQQVGQASRLPFQHSAPPQGSQRLAQHSHSDRKGHSSQSLTSLFQLVRNKMAAFTRKNCNVRLLIKCTAAEPPRTGGQALIKTA